jgi:hypothetical protein
MVENKVEEPLVREMEKPRVVRVNQSRNLPPPKPAQNNMRTVIMVGGALIGLAVISMFVFSKGTKKEKGPTIVEVTDVKREERRSEKSEGNVNNKMSSPRIIFGNLRKNPSLVVAPSISE